MRIRTYIGMSVDGFVATTGGGPAWGERFDPRAYGYNEFIQQIDTVVIGRTTFDQAVSTFGLQHWPFQGKSVHVLTSHALSSPGVPEGAAAWHDGAGALLTHLRAAPPTRDVWVMGGPRTIQAFRELQAIDRLEIYLLPLLLGEGIPLFRPGEAPATLRLDRQRAFPDGTVQLVYAPA